LGTLHEVSKAHPRDWENPGRVRVQWKKDGRLVNSTIKTSALNSPRTQLHGDENRFRREAAFRADMLPDSTSEAREYPETTVSYFISQSSFVDSIDEDDCWSRIVEQRQTTRGHKIEVACCPAI
jgi:hypothetical protein